MRGFFVGDIDDEDEDDEEEGGREVDENNIWILRYINCRASRI
jgi:hypothetical protein